MNTIGNLPKNVLRNDVPPDTQDEIALKHLGLLLAKATRRLSQLGHNPVAIAASPSRFNDNIVFQGWLAVRCGEFFSQNDGFGPYDFEKDISLASSDVKAAHAILLELEAAQWRELFGKSFGFRWSDQSLSIVVQDETSWLVFSSNNWSKDGDPVFTIGASGHITYFGEAEDRFDWAIQEPVPLKFRVKSGFEEPDGA